MLSGFLVVGAAPARAQDAAQGFNALALDWARGRWASPLICEIAGEPQRGLRRLMISPGPRRIRPRVDVIRFTPLDARKATRCFDDLGSPALEIEGSLQIRPPRRSRIDAQRDFEQALKRDHGIEFKVEAGVLRVSGIAGDAAAPLEVDLAGASLWLREVRPGSDDSRLLADFKSPRKMHLEISGVDGFVLRLPIFLSAPR